MEPFNWQHPDWPYFRYNLDPLYERLVLIAEKTGTISGKLIHLEEHQKSDVLIQVMLEEAIKTSEIEGEFISRPDIRSSIKNKLGLFPGKKPIHDQRAQGIVDMIFDVRQTYKEPLTDQKLFEWHLMLLGSSIQPNLKIGSWRTHSEPMQIVSKKRGGQWVVHYEAPPSAIIPHEMSQFIDWFNYSAPAQPDMIQFASVRAAIAHLYFESIHPFEDGNGRIGRALVEKVLSQGCGYPILISLSQTIEAEKKAYYAALHKASFSNEITDWIKYFIDVILKALFEIESQIDFTIKKAKFFDKFEKVLNERQLKVVRRMMEAGIKGFEGGMSAKKYMRITDVSKATATRDLQQLLEIHAVCQKGKGRSIRYELALS